MFLGGGHLGFSKIVISVNATAKWATDLESLPVKINIEFVFLIIILRLLFEFSRSKTISVKIVMIVVKCAHFYPTNRPDYGECNEFKR